MKEPSINPHKILIIQLGGIGDVIMSTPTIEALRRHYKRAYIALLVISRASSLIEGLPYIDELFDIDTELISLRKLFNILYLFKIVKLIRELRGKQFDMVINLKRIWTWWGAFKTAVFIKLIRAKYSVGKYTSKSFFYSMKVKEPKGEIKHMVEENLDIARALGCKIKTVKLSLPIPDKERKFILGFMRERGLSENDKLIGFNPGAFRPSRRWPLLKWSELADRLIEEYNCKIIIAGSKNDSFLIDEIKRKIRRKRMIVTVTDFTLKQYAALMEKLTLFITNDTGPMHMAAAVGVPIIALFGSGEEEMFYPYPRNSKHIVIRKKVSCAPCYRFKCKNNICMQLITVHEVMWQVKKILK